MIFLDGILNSGILVTHTLFLLLVGILLALGKMCLQIKVIGSYCTIINYLLN
jgi:hypothetical protein